eukprot:13805216-Alexandrium_andersonii.AAC.1
MSGHTGTPRYRRCAPRAPRFAKRPRCLELQLKGSSCSAHFKPWTRMLRPVGPAGTAAPSMWSAGPFSNLASVLCGH